MNKTAKKQKNLTPEEPGTTGHVWDGIREYTNPLPRWWLWIFYLTIVWAVGYVIVYPAIPMLKQATPGLFGYSTRAELEKTVDAYKNANEFLDTALVTTELDHIADNPELTQYALSGGAAVFRTYCAQCHGSGAAGAKGYPNLLDDDWLWGGSLEDIYLTILYGIRTDDPDTRFSEMPPFNDVLDQAQIYEVEHFVLSLSGSPHNPALVPSGEVIFAENCASCHGDDGKGDPEVGAPDLTDHIWLFGNDQRSIFETIANSRNGIMPAWKDRLTESQLRQVAFYVHQLGGGE